MDVALALFRYFPHGGMQRDLMATARSLQARGHAVTVYCHTFDAPVPDDLAVEVLRAPGRTNHARATAFARAFAERAAAARPDVVLGFDKMPGLDLYFAADPCFVARTADRPWPYRWTTRYRAFSALERGVFEAGGARVLLLDARQQESYQQHYGTPSERFLVLPPGVALDRRRGDDAPERRRRCREVLALPEDAFVLLMLAANFELKGLDRVLRGIASLEPSARARTHLLAVGGGAAPKWTAQLDRLGLSTTCHLLPGRDDVPDLLQAADLVVHPARRDTTATVLLEAVAAGVPVLCTSVCGYADHIRSAKSGVVLDEPFSQPQFDRALGELVTTDLTHMQRAARSYAAEIDLHGMHARIADEVEQRYESGRAT